MEPEIKIRLEADPQTAREEAAPDKRLFADVQSKIASARAEEQAGFQKRYEAEKAATIQKQRYSAYKANIEEGPADVIDPSKKAAGGDLFSKLSGVLGGGEGAGAAGGVGGAVAAAAGPVAIAYAASEALSKAFQGVRQGVEGASEVLQDFASNKNEQALRRMGDGFANVVEKAGLAGKVWSEEIRVVQSFGRAVGDVTNAFIQRGKEIEAFSGELLAANVRSELAGLQADIREAKELGPGIAKMVDQQTRMDQTFREILLPLKQWLIEHLAQLLKRIADFMEMMRPVAKVVGTTLEIALAPLEEASRELGLILDWAKKLGERFGMKFDDHPGDVTNLTSIFNQMNAARSQLANVRVLNQHAEPEVNWRSRMAEPGLRDPSRLWPDR